MTGRAADGDSDWDGPEWAAPERAERLASHPEYGRHDRTLGYFADFLVKGSWTAEQFRDALAFKQRIDRNVARHIADGECGPECRGERA